MPKTFHKNLGLGRSEWDYSVFNLHMPGFAPLIHEQFLTLNDKCAASAE
jgi:hypothetical protein